MERMKNTRKINILFLLPKAIQGGAETQLLYLIRGLNRNKFNLYLGFLYEFNEMKEDFNKIKDLKIINFKKKNSLDLSIYFKIAQFIRRDDIDIVHAFLGTHHAYLSALLAGKAVPVGGIMGAHDKEPPFAERVQDITLGKFFTRLNNLVLVSCSYAGEEDYIKKGFPAESVYAIPNGIDYDRFAEGSKNQVIKEFNLKDKVVLGIVGRLVEVKNHDKLIRMFKELTVKYDNIVLLIVGAGPLMESLKKLAEELELTRKVIFTGNRKDIPDLLAAMDMFVFPSLTEGWPNSVGEAMAAGIPVVSFDVGDVKKVIRNGFDGFIVGKDMNKLMKVAENLIENPRLRKRVGENARSKIKNNFSVERMVREYETFYVKQLEKRS